jgi:hypothetical protein
MDKVYDEETACKRPVNTPPPFNKQEQFDKSVKSIVLNKDIMMGFIGVNNSLPAYEDLIPFNYDLYKLIKTNQISLSTFKGIQNIDWYNLNLLAYVACNKITFY